MSICIIYPNRDPQPWLEALKSFDPSLDIRIWPDDGNREEIEFVVAWSQMEGVFQNYPNLKCISSMGAGVDHILKDNYLPPGVAITRVVNPELVSSMSEYMIAAVMSHIRQLKGYYENQQQKLWKRASYRSIQNVSIGVMGLGQMGYAVATRLSQLGFKVLGWSRSKKSLEGISTFYDKEQFSLFLSNVEILICLLPLTQATLNILNRVTLSQLPKGAYLINVARGEHIVEEDLLQMIDKGHISGAFLDVFRKEPLPKEHPFWEHPKVTVTPHIASLPNPISVAPQIIDNYRRLKTGKPLLNQVDIERGY